MVTTSYAQAIWGNEAVSELLNWNKSTECEMSRTSCNKHMKRVAHQPMCCCCCCCCCCFVFVAEGTLACKGFLGLSNQFCFCFVLFCVLTFFVFQVQLFVVFVFCAANWLDMSVHPARPTIRAPDVRQGPMADHPTDRNEASTEGLLTQRPRSRNEAAGSLLLAFFEFLLQRS